MPRMTRVEVDRNIFHISQRQLGLISISQAQAIGIHRESIRQRVNGRMLSPMFTGVYRLNSAPETDHQRALAACLSRPGAALAGKWAALVHGFPIPQHELRYYDVALSVSETQRARQRGITVTRHRFVVPTQPWMCIGLSSTPPATLLELAPQLPASLLGRCVDHCLAHSLIVVDDTIRWLTYETAHRVIGRRVLLNELQQRMNGVAFRSKNEVNVARWLNTRGLTGWTSNHKVTVSAGPPIEVDFAWIEARVVLEVSPFFTHGSKAKQQRDAERRRLLVLAGWRIVEADDRHLISAEAFTPIADALRELLRAIRR
jgi:very-short-patch-repair endonuclease